MPNRSGPEALYCFFMKNGYYSEIPMPNRLETAASRRARAACRPFAAIVAGLRRPAGPGGSVRAPMEAGRDHGWQTAIIKFIHS